MELALTLPGRSWKLNVTINKEGRRLFFKYDFCKEMNAEVKAMAGAKYHGFEDPPRKCWSVEDTPRNWFTLRYMAGENVYAIYDKPVIKIDVPSHLTPWEHQTEFTQEALTRHRKIFPYEMGTGKTLAAQMTMDLSGSADWWWIGTKGSLREMSREWNKWKPKVRPRFMTYDELKKVVASWQPGMKAPKGVVFDEASKIKSPTSQRSQAAMHLSLAIEQDWGDEGYVILMTGTPSPKDPCDWWHLCFSGDTWILSESGPRRAVNMKGDSDERIILNGIPYKTNTGTFSKGFKPVYEVTTKEGYKFKATKDHRVLTTLDDLEYWSEVQYLQRGTKIKLNNHSNITWESNGQSKEEGYLVGLLIGDGSVSKHKETKSGFEPKLIFYTEEDHQIIPYVKSILRNYTESGRDGLTVIEGKDIEKLRWSYGIRTEKSISNILEECSSNFLEGMIAGLFDTDGSVEKDRARVTLYQSDLLRLESIQRILLYFGIPSRITVHGLGGKKKFGRRVINQGKSWALTVSGEHVKTFSSRIILHHPEKAHRLRMALNVESQMSQKFEAEVISVKLVGEEEVFDISVPGPNAFSGNGFVLHNCEVAKPGFLREGTYQKFKNRLSYSVQKQGEFGIYPEHVTWWDDAKKCKHCGKLEEKNPAHTVELAMEACIDFHQWQPSINEVERLYQRMKGLVTIKMKKDVMKFLPDKRYVCEELTPTPSTLRTAKLLLKTAKNVISGLTALRELSDGFQYVETPMGKDTCPLCNGTGKSLVWYLKTEPEAIVFEVPADRYDDYAQRKEMCTTCNGEGQAMKYSRTTKEVACPKDDYLIDLLENHEDSGRFICYAGFTGSIDRIVNLSHKQGWSTIRVDSRGWHATDYNNNPINPAEIFGTERGDPYLTMFQEGRNEQPRVNYVGHAKSGGMGVTLTSSLGCYFWSNSFDAEDRWQAEDRGHRNGMDIQKGFTIYDGIHLPTDRLVLNNLLNKKDLQNMSLGIVQQAIDAFEGVRET